MGDVIASIDARIGTLAAERIPLGDAAGRVLAVPIRAAEPVPPFDRAAMDGFALGARRRLAPRRTRRLFSALSVDLDPAGDLAATSVRARPSRSPREPRCPPRPTRLFRSRFAGSMTISSGWSKRLRRAATSAVAARTSRPALSYSRQNVFCDPGSGSPRALGIAVVAVVRRPQVAVLVTGDELLPAGTPARRQIADMNSVMVEALVRRDGGLPCVLGPFVDDRDILEQALADAAGNSDAVLISGGSSTGPEDHAPGVVARLGSLDVHGVALRPASPAGLGFVGKVPVVLLPGNPVSCLCAYDFFAGRIIRRLGGRSVEWSYRSLVLPLARKLASSLGRLDYVRVRIGARAGRADGDRRHVDPSSTTRADGFVMVPADLEGYPAGATVRVWLYDG